MRGGLTIRAALFGSFAAVALLVAAYAAWSIGALGSAQGLVERTFDRSMIALNATRAAEATAYEIKGASLEDRARLLDVLVADLSVVANRAPGDAAVQAQAMVETIGRWQQDGLPTDYRTLIADDFLVLSELLAGDAYIEREAAISAVAGSVRLAWGALGAVMLVALLFAAFLTRSIVGPLTGAATAARQIAEGDFEAELPQGRGTEIRTLLGSMAVMQTSIAGMMAKEASRAETAEALLSGAIENAADGVVLVDPQGRVITANAQAERLSGTRLPEGERLQALLADAHGDDLADRLTEGGEAETPDGCFVRAARADSKEGGEVVIWADITDIREREAALAAASDAKSRFMATISHELKTPLNAVIGFSDLLRSEAMGPMANDEYRGFAEEIHKAGSGLLSIISDILGFVSAQNQNYAADGDDIDVSRLVERIAESITDADKFSDVVVTTSIDSDLPVLSGHELTLTRALGHLIDNAAHFAAKGGGHVDVRARRADGGAELLIADDGPGMNADGLARAQGVFGQVDDSLTRKHEGAGLGIPFARSVIEAHDGRLLLDSTPGQGTQVTIWLPARGLAERQAA